MVEQSGTEQSGWAQRLARWSIGLTVAAVAVAAIGLTLARYDIIGKLPGFLAFLAGTLMALLALIAGLVALFAGRKQPLQSRGRLFAALAVSLVLVGFVATRPLAAGEAPSIHDITTDLASPPQFKTLSLRADNLTGVGTVENWRRIHAGAYGDLGPVEIARPVAAVTADAVRLAKAAGWDVVRSDPALGEVEATVGVSYIRFYDDVAIRIVPIDGGKRSRVDMRSVSRVGVGDLGVNAKRIRAFLDALKAA